MRTSRRPRTWLLAAALVAGCAGSPAAISKLSPEEVARQPTGPLLNACERGFGSSLVVWELRRRDDIRVMDVRRCPELLAEFVYRGDVRAKYAEDIRAGKVLVGMTTTEMMVAWGKPLRIEQPGGGRVRHAYGVAGPFVVTQNEVVVGFED